MGRRFKIEGGPGYLVPLCDALQKPAETQKKPQVQTVSTWMPDGYHTISERDEFVYVFKQRTSLKTGRKAMSSLHVASRCA